MTGQTLHGVTVAAAPAHLQKAPRKGRHSPAAIQRASVPDGSSHRPSAGSGSAWQSLRSKFGQPQRRSWPLGPSARSLDHRSHLHQRSSRGFTDVPHVDESGSAVSSGRRNEAVLENGLQPVALKFWLNHAGRRCTEQTSRASTASSNLRSGMSSHCSTPTSSGSLTRGLPQTARTARAVGYAAEFAFRRAFKRAMGAACRLSCGSVNPGAEGAAPSSPRTPGWHRRSTLWRSRSPPARFATRT